MFGSLMIWGIVGAGIIALGSLIVVVFVWFPRYEHRRTYHRPILCVCEVNSLMGVMLRDDFHTASHNYWKRHYDGEYYDFGGGRTQLGRLIEAPRVFVFETWSLEYYTITQGCYVEKAVFRVPSFSADELNPTADAYRYIHGKPWNGVVLKKP